MKCYIICSAPNSDIEPIKAIRKNAGDVVVCADGGYEYAQAAGIVPDVVVGDFDSVERGVPEGSFELQKFNVHKDDTDAKLAVIAGINHGCTEFEFHAATGGRFDHMFANVLLLLWIEKQGFRASMVDGDARYFFVDKKHTFGKGQRRTVSLFAIAEAARGIVLKGFEYPLNGYDMEMYDSLGISNVIIEDEASIELSSGRIFVVEYTKKKG